MPVVVVESPAKAKTIEKYLGDDFTVLASYGHVSDLPPKDGSVLPDRDFEMIYETSEKAHKPLKAIAQALKGGGNLVLATDPVREGEAISWHVLYWLKEGGKLGTLHLSHVHAEGLGTLVANEEQVARTLGHQVETQTLGGR